MGRADRDKADETRNAAAEKQYEQEGHADHMAREVLGGLNHDDAIANENDGVEPELAIGIGIVDAAHTPAVMDDG